MKLLFYVEIETSEINAPKLNKCLKKTISSILYEKVTFH